MTDIQHPAARRIAWLPALTLAAALPAAAQVNDPAFRDYFLVGEFGEICTMCEAVVLCEAGDASPSYAVIPDAGTFTVYHLQTRTFWSQVGTIWEWFMSNFSPRAVDGHARPIHVHRVEDGRWAPMAVEEARVSLDPPYITLSDRRIERVEARWQTVPEGENLGFCRQMPLWASLEQITARSPGGDAR